MVLVLLAGGGAQRASAQTPTGYAGAGSGEGDTAPAPARASGPATASAKAAASRDISDTLAGDDRFATLSQALRSAGLMTLLKSKGPFTLFAPTDEAWKKMASGPREELLAQPARLKAILTYHILKGRVDNVGLHKLRNALTMGGIVTIDYTSGVKISGGVVTGADIVCRNGIVHAIDKVLLPVPRSGPRPAPAGKTVTRKPAVRQARAGKSPSAQ